MLAWKATVAAMLGTHGGNAKFDNLDKLYGPLFADQRVIMAEPSICTSNTWKGKYYR
jgi:hypothetical protein